MAYEPMIHLYKTRLQEATDEAVLDMILRKITKMGVMVEREELLKALRYDRQQYEKGYADGRADAQKWISVQERLPEDEEYVLCWYKDEFGDEWSTVGLKIQWGCGWDLDIDDNSGRNLTVTHWMPLPEPPKEGEHATD